MPTNVDPGAGLLKEALKTPFIKDILRLNLQRADPARAAWSGPCCGRTWSPSWPCWGPCPSWPTP